MTAARRDHGIALEEPTVMVPCCILLWSKASHLKTYYQAEHDDPVFAGLRGLLNQFRRFEVAD
jgi:hypothetical protein